MSVTTNRIPFANGHPHFIDHRRLEWTRIRSTSYLVHQRFHYDYPGPVHELRHRLMVIPADHHGYQRLKHHQIEVSIPALMPNSRFDTFGNRIVEYQIDEVDKQLTFEVWSEVHHSNYTGERPIVPSSAAAHYLAPTRLTTADRTLAAAGRELWRQQKDPWLLAESINRWTYGVMRYQRGVTTVNTPAAEALAIGGGLCQDFSHIMLTVCRSLGLPARYVSGHLLGEGGSHAWVEVLLPGAHDGELEAWAFDPTNHCLATRNYITIAVGRDYADISPTSGSFRAPYGGRLTVSKQAGLTAVEYLDGQLVRAGENGQKSP